MPLCSISIMARGIATVSVTATVAARSASPKHTRPAKFLKPDRSLPGGVRWPIRGRPALPLFCYAHAVDSHFEQIRAANALPREAVEVVKRSGVLIIPGPLSGERFDALVEAYEQLMTQACGPDFKVASTTTRMSDLLSFSAAFDEVFLYPPLLEACSHLIDEPFKLSSFPARTLRAGTPAQELHADLPRSSEDAPLIGFILMIDTFRGDNGATRFVPGSHQWPDVPSDIVLDTRAQYPGEVLAFGDPGTIVLFNAAIWHGHTANVTARPRRSIQGYFVRRNAAQGFCFRDRLADHVQKRMSPLARYILDLDKGR
jgi:hypothetical protein